jgi:hypothetical protein
MASACAAGPAGLHHGNSQDCSTLVTLEQALSPKARPPGPLMYVVRGLCARVLQNMMADLRKEVHRRQQLADAAERDAAADAATAGYAKGKAGSKAVASLPVASITASGMRSSSSSSAWFEDVVALQGSSKRSSSSSSAGAGGFLSLPDLLAAAVPLEITIRL